MIFAEMELSHRLEATEAWACAQFAEARARVFPESGAATLTIAGATVVFDGVDSPCTQTFGLGLFEELTEPGLDAIEEFFLERSAPVLHEVSPYAGVPTLDLLCRRGYRPEELSNVLFQPIATLGSAPSASINVRIPSEEEAALWAEISARGWAHDHTELLDFMREFGSIAFKRPQSPCFLAELDGVPGAAGSLCMHEGVALFAGAATVPEMRHRGLQSALLAERLRYAQEHGCDLAMMVALPGGESQRNAERNGFRIAYTRTKWRLHGQEEPKPEKSQG